MPTLRSMARRTATRLVAVRAAQELPGSAPLQTAVAAAQAPMQAPLPDDPPADEPDSGLGHRLRTSNLSGGPP